MDNSVFLTLKSGQIFLYISLFTSIFGLVLSMKKDVGVDILSKIEKLVVVPILLSCINLVIALVRGDFFIKFVAEHSNSHLPFIYKITALWGGQEGSLLLWSLLLSVQLAISGKKHRISYALNFFTLSFFLFLTAFITKTFEFVYPPPEDGRELNPLLQHFGMVLHPIFLYLGLTGTILPFSLYISKILGFEKNYRKWAVFNWSWLTLGIVVGGWWAYSELGWGGYWAWDPVENVSFAPWLTLTTFLHTSMLEDKFKQLRTFNFILITITFVSAMVGTFLVRSGMFISVHSFVQNPELGIAFLVLVAVIISSSIYIYFSQREKFQGKDLKVKSVFSREFFILLGTSVLLTMWVTVVLGTIFPVIYESITGDKISFGKPYYNKIFGPLSLFLILFMSIGQYLPWGEGKYKLKNYITPLLLSTLAFIITFAFVGEFEIAFSMLFISFGLFVILREFIRDGIKSGRILPMISHIGFFILCSGIAFSQLLYKEGEFGMLPEEKVEFDKYTIKFLGLENSKGPNWEGIRATFEIQENSEKFKISSEKRMYLTWDEPTTEAGIKYGLFEDFYIVFIKLEEGKIFVKVWHNPAVSFIWIGTAIMFIGGMGKFLKKLLKK